MKKLILAALVAASVVSPAKAYDDWNRSGFSVNHHYYGWNLGTNSGMIIAGPPATQSEIGKARHEQRVCAPVVMWTDEGRIVHPAMGCRR